MTTPTNPPLPSLSTRATANRLTRICLWAAGAWALGLIVAAATVPVYHSTSVSASTTAGDRAGLLVTSASGPATLIAVNGYPVLAAVGAPLAVVAVVTVALWRRRQRGRRGPGPVASGAVALLGLAALLAILSIGIAIVPVTVLLAMALFDAPGTPSPRTRWTPGPAPSRSG